MSRKTTMLLMLLLVATSLGLFHPTFFALNGQVYKFVTYVCSILLIVGSWRTTEKCNAIFVYSVLGISICQILSAFNAYQYFGQSLGVSILATLQGFAYILLIPFMKSKLKTNDMEQIVQVFAVFFIIFSLINRLTSVPLFGKADDTIDRGVVRFRVIGVYWAMLFLLMKANAFALSSSRKNLLWALIAMFAIILTLTRQNILVAFFMASLLFFMRVNWKKKIMYIVAVLTVFFVVLPQSQIYNSLVEKTESDREAQDQYDNIRLVAAEYFLEDCPRNISQTLFGHGTPSFGNSSYGRQYENFQAFTGIYREDVGYCGFFYDFGLVSTTFLIFLFVKALFMKIPKRYLYLKYFAGAFLILNIASAPCLANYNIIPFMLCLAMMHKANIESECSKNLCIQ